MLPLTLRVKLDSRLVSGALGVSGVSETFRGASIMGLPADKSRASRQPGLRLGYLNPH